MVNGKFKKLNYTGHASKGSKVYMSNITSVGNDLDMLANLAAKLMATPVASITIYESDHDGGDALQAIAHNSVACDQGWLERHPEIDIHQLGSPRTAVAQHLGLYAAIPLRNGDGQSIGMISCADDDDRELSEEQLETLKHLAALSVAIIHG